MAAIAAGCVVLDRARRADRRRHRASRPSVAVLYFENNTGDASLDWMRTGLTDMLVTDLSQSTDFEVLGTDRLRTDPAGAASARTTASISGDIVQADRRARRRGQVLVGSYVKAGEAIRINARLQKARTGRIVNRRARGGTGAASVFCARGRTDAPFKTKHGSISADAAGAA